MRTLYKTGDLVHIPQNVRLLRYETNIDETNIDGEPSSPWQLPFPKATWCTEKPAVGVVIAPARGSGLLQVFCEGGSWSVDKNRVYSLNGIGHD
jgi:hypothetical protein